jgi:NTP pyrophosphatase (non-canonical NTP hydrolase)
MPGPQGHFPDYDRYLKLIADAQRYKLRINAHKGDLGSVDVNTLMECLVGEINELREAISRKSEIEILLECADVSNFALGIAISAIRDMNDPSTPAAQDKLVSKPGKIKPGSV